MGKRHLKMLKILTKPRSLREKPFDKFLNEEIIEDDTVHIPEKILDSAKYLWFKKKNWNYTMPTLLSALLVCVLLTYQNCDRQVQTSHNSDTEQSSNLTEPNKPISGTPLPSIVESPTQNNNISSYDVQNIELMPGQHSSAPKLFASSVDGTYYIEADTINGHSILKLSPNKEIQTIFSLKTTSFSNIKFATDKVSLITAISFSANDKNFLLMLDANSNVSQVNTEKPISQLITISGRIYFIELMGDNLFELEDNKIKLVTPIRYSFPLYGNSISNIYKVGNDLIAQGNDWQRHKGAILYFNGSIFESRIIGDLTPYSFSADGYIYFKNTSNNYLTTYTKLHISELKKNQIIERDSLPYVGNYYHLPEENITEDVFTCYWKETRAKDTLISDCKSVQSQLGNSQITIVNHEVYKFKGKYYSLKYPIPSTNDFIIEPLNESIYEEIEAYWEKGTESINTPGRPSHYSIQDTGLFQTGVTIYDVFSNKTEYVDLKNFCDKTSNCITPLVYKSDHGFFALNVVNSERGSELILIKKK